MSPLMEMQVSFGDLFAVLKLMKYVCVCVCVSVRLFPNDLLFIADADAEDADVHLSFPHTLQCRAAHWRELLMWMFSTMMFSLLVVCVAGCHKCYLMLLLT